jgi:hypothetical protein
MGAPFVLSVGRRSVRSRSFRSRNAGNLESLPQNNRQHVIGKMPQVLTVGSESLAAAVIEPTLFDIPPELSHFRENVSP